MYCNTKREKIIGVYEIQNKTNGKIYIGSSVDVWHRWYRHKNNLNQNKHANIYLQRSWNKHGEEMFEFNLLEVTEKEDEVIEREQYWMDLSESYNRKKGYNIARFAGNTLGVFHSEETKKKIGRKSIERNAVKSIYGMSVRGEEHPLTKLTNLDVKEIKYILEKSNLTLDEVGSIFKVTKSVVWHIKNELNWRHIKFTKDFKLRRSTKDKVKKLEKSSVVRLSKEDIKNIRIISRDYNITQKKIGEMFGVKRHRITDIVNYRTHKDITINKDDLFNLKGFDYKWQKLD